MSRNRTCAGCGALLDYGNVRAEPGPGASREHPLFARLSASGG